MIKRQFTHLFTKLQFLKNSNEGKTFAPVQSPGSLGRPSERAERFVLAPAGQHCLADHDVVQRVWREIGAIEEVLGELHGRSIREETECAMAGAHGAAAWA